MEEEGEVEGIQRGEGGAGCFQDSPVLQCRWFNHHVLNSSRTVESFINNDIRDESDQSKSKLSLEGLTFIQCGRNLAKASAPLHFPHFSSRHWEAFGDKCPNVNL